MRHVIASGLIDFFTGTAGSQFFGSLSGAGIEVDPETPPKAFFTLSMTDGRSAAATVFFDR
jgi:hypothetical protein